MKLVINSGVGHVKTGRVVAEVAANPPAPNESAAFQYLGQQRWQLYLEKVGGRGFADAEITDGGTFVVLVDREEMAVDAVKAAVAAGLIDLSAVDSTGAALAGGGGTGWLAD